MNNTIKIEFECPEFDSELEINIVIRKDGKEVVVDSTASSPDPKTITTKKNKKITEEVQETKTTKSSKKKAEVPSGRFITGDELESAMNGSGGNFMNMDF